MCASSVKVSTDGVNLSLLFLFLSGLVALALDELVPILVLMLCWKVPRSKAACLFKNTCKPCADNAHIWCRRK